MRDKTIPGTEQAYSGWSRCFPSRGGCCTCWKCVASRVLQCLRSCCVTCLLSPLQHYTLRGDRPPPPPPPPPPMMLFVGCLPSQQHASVSQGRICSDNSTCCHTDTEVADPTFYRTQSHYTDTGPTSPRANPTTPGAWQGSHFLSHWYDSTSPGKIPSQARFELRTFRFRGGRLNHLANEAVPATNEENNKGNQLTATEAEVCVTYSLRCFSESRFFLMLLCSLSILPPCSAGGRPRRRTMKASRASTATSSSSSTPARLGEKCLCGTSVCTRPSTLSRVQALERTQVLVCGFPRIHPIVCMHALAFIHIHIHAHKHNSMHK